MPRQPFPDAANVAVDLLDLDKRNPRITETLRNASQRELLLHLGMEYSLIRLARSIARHGYFPSEPLIAIKEDGRLVVVEGNRRLATLKLLRSPELLGELPLDHSAEWKELAGSKNVPSEVPTIVIRSRPLVAPILGYRHIAGIEPWDPWAKARFIAGLVDDDGLSFARVAELVGDDERDVRAHYRNQAIVGSARTAAPEAAERATQEFGVFTRAMNSPQLRKHIGAPDTSDVKAGAGAAGTQRKKAVREVLSWLFGDEDTEALIEESRDLTRLGKIVGTGPGLEALRAGRTLQEAEEAAGGAKARLLRRLNTALHALEVAKEDIRKFSKGADVQALLTKLHSALDELK